MTKSTPSIFERIALRELPASIIREDDDFLAFLDIFPNCEGQTLVIPKKRYDSDISMMPDEVYGPYMQAVKHVIHMLKVGLGVKRVGVIMEGLGVNHAHVKLYPMHGLPEEREAHVADEKVWFDTYPGYLTTHTGPQRSGEQLDGVVKKICG